MLCGLASPVLAAIPFPRQWFRLALIGAGFLAASWLWAGRVPDAARVGAVLAFLAVARLLWPRRLLWIAPLAAGATASLAYQILFAQGLPLPLAAVVAVIPPFVSAWLASVRPRFASTPMVEEALLVLFVLGLAVAIAPGLSEGWSSAVALTAAGSSGGARPLPSWTLVTAFAALALGGCVSLWRHR